MKRVLLLISIISIAFWLPASAAQHDEFPVSPPPFSEGIFPCSNCHAGLEVNTKKRELKTSIPPSNCTMRSRKDGALIVTIAATAIN